MNCSLANLTEAIGVIEFLVVASRFTMISMVGSNSHISHVVSNYVLRFLDHFYVYMYQVSLSSRSTGYTAYTKFGSR